MSNYGRYGGSRKRKYEDESYDDMKRQKGYADEETSPANLENEMETLVFRLGEKSNTPIESSIETIASFVDAKIATNKTEVLNLLYECITKLPDKIGIYTGLIGLLNVKNYNFISEFIEFLAKNLKESLRNNLFFVSHRMLRFISNLINVRVITSQSLFDIYESFVSLTIVKSEHRIQTRVDFYIYCVLSTLPWCGKELYDKHGPQVDDLLKSIGSYIKKRDKSYMPLLKVWMSDDSYPQEDYLECLWEQIKKLDENDWKENLISRPYQSFANTLKSSLSHEFPLIVAPEHAEKIPYSLPRIIFRMFDYTDVPEEYILPGAHSIERFLIEEQLHSLVNTYYHERKVCAQQLMQLSSAYNARVPLNYMIVEVILAQMFSLPKPPHIEIMFGSLLIELCKLQPTQMPMILAQATELLFDRLDTMKVSCIDRFANWFAYHLSNFQFKWSWDDWRASLESGDCDSAKVKFVRETLVRCMRLSYHQRIVEMMPQEMSALVPPPPRPIYKYESEDAANLDGTVYANRLLEMIKERCLPEDVIQLLREIPDRKDEVKGEPGEKQEQEQPQDVDMEFCNPLKIEVFTSTLLYFGCKSFSHVFAALAKFHMIFKMIVETEESQIIVLKTLHEVWRNHQQMIVVIVDKMLKTQIVECSAVVNWIFTEEMSPDFNCFYVWEILHSTIKKMSKQVDKLQNDYVESDDKLKRSKMELTSSIDTSAEEDELKFKLERLNALKDEQKRLFLIVFTNFIELINKFIAKSGETSKEKIFAQTQFKWIYERFQDVLLTHYEEITPYYDELKPQLITERTEEVIVKAFEMFSSFRL